MCVRFTELYNNKVYDLLNNRAACSVREDGCGEVHIRAETIKHDDGRVSVQHVREEYATTAAEVAAIVAHAQRMRATGVSTLHDQSSRSHAILELEVVTQAVVARRAAIIDAESEVAPAGAARDAYICSERMRQFRMVPPVKYGFPPTFERVAGVEADEAGMAAHNRKVVALEAAVEAAREAEAAAIAAGPPCTGGKLVFVDLAGAEHGADGDRGAARLGRVQTPQERREARQINTSLLALKECMRALAAEKRRKRSQRPGPSKAAAAAAAVAAAAEPEERKLEGCEAMAKATREFLYTAMAVGECSAAAEAAGLAADARRARAAAAATTGAGCTARFRSSRLTMLLKRFLLAQDSATTMIANVSPAAAHQAKTLNTLSYAQGVAKAAMPPPTAASKRRGAGRGGGSSRGSLRGGASAGGSGSSTISELRRKGRAAAAAAAAPVCA